MKLATLTFTTLLGASIYAHALYVPGNVNVPVYLCESQDLQTSVFHQGSKSVVTIEEMGSNQKFQKVVEAPVNEISNQTQTVYSSESDDLILKINHNSSGLMPGTLFVSQENQAHKIDLKCHVVFRIMKNNLEM